ncbi:MAG: glutamine--fructose-6-phosphate transaminase (isomerizing) [Candidatus Omnitrophica bacterium]|jgi:glucosamine--fructose-6-phosphate aminotransferase (isomerizing)|nr:glutamine--fructose-6-phosphate transaminase (isomerizing) [Candidatus Omnitrophota bacterium]
MCGILGYIGKERALGTFLDGLSRLEYRGYDSCGVVGIKEGEFFLKKQPGKIHELRSELKDFLEEKFPIGIFHTRWATHGRPSQANAHPHLDCKSQIAIVHNGIIENYLKLKEALIKEGHKFISETDTEVVAHLIEKFYKGSLREAVCKAIKNLHGSFSLGVISIKDPTRLIAVRKGSPLIVGLSKDGNFIASDIPAILPFAKEVVYLKDEEIAVISHNAVKIFNFKGAPVKLEIERINIKPQDAEKKGFEHFMLKEIHEQPEALKRILSLYVKRNAIEFPYLNLDEKYFKSLKNIFITACGTAYHAGYIAKYFLEKHCDVDVEIDTSSEFRYRTLNITKNDLLLTISQSGETADTLAAVRDIERHGVKIVSICNVEGSTLAKESDGIIFTHAGPEIGVASTKAYTAQIMVLVLLALYIGKTRKTITEKDFKAMLGELNMIPEHQKDILAKTGEIKKIAKEFSKFGCFLFLARGINYPSALEGALKLKEISYIPAEGYPAGEMKHGPIALIDEYRGVVCIAPKDFLYEKMISNMQEIKARKGKVLAIVNYGDSEAVRLSDAVIHCPQLKNSDFSPMLVAVGLQLFAYYVAKNLNCEIDQPRNLAKSVTVE